MKIRVLDDGGKEQSINVENMLIGSVTLKSYLDKVVSLENKFNKLLEEDKKRTEKLSKHWEQIVGGKNA